MKGSDRLTDASETTLVEDDRVDADAPPERPAEGREASGRAPEDRRVRTGAVLSALLASIRQDLSEGAYHPRERLVEADLVARYRTTRAAVRDALIQLTTEGLVERTPNRGARVRAMSVDEAMEIAEVRRLLESLCAARAAERATAAERRQIASIARSLRAAAVADQVNEYLNLNVRFHSAIHAMARHTTAQGILARFQNRPIDRFFPQPFRPTPPSASVVQHERIADAIAAGNAAEAEAAMYEHLTNLIDQLHRFQRQSGTR